MAVLRAPTLFSMMFSAMLMDAFQESDTGFPIRYRLDGKLLNLRRLQAETKVQTDVLDDMDKIANSEAKMHRPWIKSHNHVISMILQSAHVHFTSSWKTVRFKRFITVNRQKMKALIYLPTWESLSPEQCPLMMRSLPELQKPVWHVPCTCLGAKWNQAYIYTKLKVFKTVVLPLYACETWTVYQRHAKRLTRNRFHLSSLRKLLKSSGKTIFQTQRS